MNGVMQLGYMGKMPWILVTENHGREGAIEVCRGLSRPRSIEQRMTKQPLPIFFLGQCRYVPSQKEGTVLLSEPFPVPSECISHPSCS